MRITVDRKAFVRSLSTVARATDRKASIPALGYVRLVARGDSELVLTGTDLYRIHASTIPGKVDHPGMVALDARGLLSTAKAFDGEMLEIETNQAATEASVRSGGATARLAAFALDDMPPTTPTIDRLRAAHSYTLSADTLRTALSVAFAASQDETRPHLAGVLLEIGDHAARGVATDGHRLSLRGPGGYHPILVPIRAAEDWLKALPKSGDVQVAIDAGKVGEARSAALFVDGSIMTTTLVPEHFPPYAKVIPSANPVHATLDTKATIAALKRARVAAAADYALTGKTVGKGGAFGHGVVLSIDETGMRIATNTSVETIPCEVRAAALGINPTIEKIGFNVDYLLDALKHAGASIVAHFAGALDPVVMKSGEDVDVVMPMRV